MQLPDFLTLHEYGNIRITGHRIGLFHVVEGFREGMSAQEICDPWEWQDRHEYIP